MVILFSRSQVVVILRLSEELHFLITEVMNFFLIQIFVLEYELLIQVKLIHYILLIYSMISIINEGRFLYKIE